MSTAEIAAKCEPCTRVDGGQPVCADCGAAGIRVAQAGSSFCSDTCRHRFHNRRKKHGSVICDAAKRWRRDRTPGALSELTRIVDNCLHEDREAGRRRTIKAPPHMTSIRTKG